MDAFRSIFVNAANQVLVNILCHKRNHGRSSLCHINQSRVQSHISIDLVLLHALCPETFSAASYIPVAHIIYEFLQHSCSLRNPVIVQIIIHITDHGIHLGQQPFIHNRKLIVIQGILGCIKIVNVRIQYKECIGVPQGSHKLSLSLLNRLAMETVGQPGSAVDVKIPADSICSIGFQSIKRIYGISFGLTHLLSVFILYMPQNNNIPIRSLVKNQGGNR